MKPRDRLVLMVVVAGVLLAAVYLKVVSPERSQAAALVTQVSSAQAAVSSARASALAAQAAKNKYPAAYASLLNLGKAVPAKNETASLLYQLNQASTSHQVSFDSFAAGGATAAPGAAPATPGAAPATPGAASAAAFSTLPFTLQFTGSFFDLYRLLDRLNQLTAQSTDGTVKVNGRLVTISGTTLTGDQHKLTGTITANAYVLPAPTPAPASGAVPGASPAAAPAAAAPTGAAPAVIHP